MRAKQSHVGVPELAIYQNLRPGDRPDVNPPSTRESLCDGQPLVALRV